jgi:hypothetical protein
VGPPCLRKIAPNDIRIFADGDWRQEPRYNAPDLDETQLAALFTSADGAKP